jgi:thiamine kinase-like enzyme
MVVTNRDINVEAVRLGPNDDLVVMHWDFAGPMLPAWELASALLHWSFYGGVNVAAARALLDGYRNQRGEAPPLGLGSFTTAISGWLTWLLHRACEATESVADEQHQFAQRAVKEVLDDPLTVSRLEAFLESIDAG